MKDTIIKGTGNSRTLKTVPNALTLYPDFPSMLQALIDGAFPIDIGPLNPAGVDTMGTMLDTAAVLKDTTAALYGLGAEATPNDVLAAIQPLIASAQSTANSRVRYETGSYTGNGGTSKSLYFSIRPQIVFIAGSDNITQHAFALRDSSVLIVLDNTRGAWCKVSWSGYGLTWNLYTSNITGEYGALNGNGSPYKYIALG